MSTLKETWLSKQQMSIQETRFFEFLVQNPGLMLDQLLPPFHSCFPIIQDSRSDVIPLTALKQFVTEM